MKTKRGIYYDLNESDYKLVFESLTFYFSSMLYKQKFSEKLDNYLKSESLKIGTKYNCKFDANEMFALNLYKNIEKRGFRVYYYDIKLNTNYNVQAIIRK